MPQQKRYNGKTLQDLQAEQALLGDGSINPNAPSNPNLEGLQRGFEKGSSDAAYQNIKKQFLNGQGQPTNAQLTTSPQEQAGYAAAQQMLKQRYPNSADDNSAGMPVGQAPAMRNQPAYSINPTDEELAQFEAPSKEDQQLQALQRIKQMYGK